MIVDKEIWIYLRFAETNIVEKNGEFNVTRSWCLLEAIQGFLEFASMYGKLDINKASRLGHENFFM